MIFMLRMDVTNPESVREQIVECLLAAIDTVRHENTFDPASNDLSAYVAELHAPDSRVIGRMTLVGGEDDPSEEHKDASW